MEDCLENLQKKIIEKSKKIVGLSYICITRQGKLGETLLAKQLHNDKTIRGVLGKDSILRIILEGDAEILEKYNIMRRFLGLLEKSGEGKELIDQLTQVVEEFSK